MTGPRTVGGVSLPRPAPARDSGRLDDAFYDLVEARFVRVVTEEPVFATYLGIRAAVRVDGIDRAAARH